MSQHDLEFDDSVEWLSIEVRSPPRRQKRRVGFYVGIAAAVMLVMLTLGVGAYRIYRLITPLDVHVTAHGLGDSAAMRAESVEAFSSFDGSEEALERLTAEEREIHESIAAFLDEVQACMPRVGESLGDETEGSAEVDVKAFLELVDLDALVKRIELTGRIPGYSNTLKRHLRGRLLNSLEPEPDWTEIKLARVLMPSDDAESRIVYAYTSSHAESSESEMRFILRRDAVGWKICDWERLDVGMHKSEEWAIYAAYGDSSAIQGYIAWGNLMGEVDQLMATGDIEEAKKKLKLGESYIMPPELYNLRCLYTAYRWQAAGDVPATKRCLDMITNRDEIPGVYYGLMNCCRDADFETALEFAQKYEQSVGPTPAVCKIKAKMLQQMQRRDDARGEWRQLLRINPDDSYALQQMLRSLPQDQKHEVSAHIARAREPEQIILDLADTAAWDDPESLPFLVAELEKLAPNSSASFNLRGLLQEVDGNYEAAAVSYRRAFEAEEESERRNEYAENYIELKSQLGEGVEAWQEVPDPREAFANLTYSYEEGESYLSHDEFHKIARLYQLKYPEAPEGYFYSAYLAMKKDNYAQAEPLLREAFRRVQDQDEAVEGVVDVETIANSLGRALCELGRASEVLELETQHEGLVLALTRSACFTHEVEDLRVLLDLCRRINPDEPAIHLFEAELAVSDKRWDDALSELKAAELDETDWYFRNRLYEVYVESGKTLECYAEAEDKKEVFKSLVEALQRERRWEDLATLVAQHEVDHQGDIQIVKTQAEAAWEQQQDHVYVRYAQEILNHSDADALESYERSIIQDNLFRAHLRMMNYGSALELAREDEEKKFDSLRMAQVTAATGDLQSALNASLKAADKLQSAMQLYHDEDVGHIFLGDEFHDLHDKYPINLGLRTAPVSAVFLGEQPWELTVDVLSTLLSRVGITPSGPIEKVRSLRTEVTAAFVISLEGANLWVMAGSDSFDPEWKLPQGEQPLAKTLADCEHWLAWGIAGWSEKSRGAVVEPMRTVAAEAAAGKARAMVVPDSRAYWRYEVFPGEPDQLEQWRLTGDMRPLADRGLKIDLNYTAAENDSDRKFENQLAQNAAHFKSTPETELELLVNLQTELGICPLRVAVTEVRRRYGGMEFVGKLVEDSRLIRELQKGQPVEVSNEMVHAWRVNSDPAVFRAVQAVEP